MIVLDTHSWFWWINLEHHRFSRLMKAALEGNETLGVSVVSCYEITLEAERGRLCLPCPATQWLAEALEPSGVQLLLLSPEIISLAVNLTAAHRNLVDDIIVATTLFYDAKLISLDGVFQHYPELQDRLLE